MSRALSLSVVQNDDGSAPGMHDLEVVNADGTRGAVEVTSASDEAAIELWNVVNGGDERWRVPELDGGWMVSLEPTARAKRVMAELPAVLRELELQGRTDLRRSRSEHDGPSALLRALGVTRVHQGGSNFRGAVYFTIERDISLTAGFVADTGDALASWVGAFLREPRCRSDLAKLERAATAQRHAFVWLPGFAAAPFSVADLLMRTDAPLPQTDPPLPDEVTHVWLASGWATGNGFRWDPGSGWLNFEKFVSPSD